MLWVRKNNNKDKLNSVDFLIGHDIAAGIVINAAEDLFCCVEAIEQYHSTRTSKDMLAMFELLGLDP